jgi:DNA-binding NarL/FixJ family response regulator
MAVIRKDVSVVVADGDPVVRESLPRLLAAQGFSVADAVPGGDAALAAIERDRPTICIAHVRLGLELARRAARTAPDVRMLLRFGDGDAELVPEALAAGARGLVLERAPLDDIVDAIDVVAAGGPYVDAALAASLARRRGLAGARLSAWECEILHLLAGGASVAEIGEQLLLAADAVRIQADRAMTKLGARTHAHAVALAVRERIIV